MLSNLVPCNISRPHVGGGGRDVVLHWRGLVSFPGLLYPGQLADTEEEGLGECVMCGYLR